MSPPSTAGEGGEGGQVVVMGSLNVDLTVRTERFPQPGETLTGSELRTAPGGKSSNQAVAAALLGSLVRMLGAVGEDDNGTFLLRAAEEAGLDVRGVHRLGDHATGSAMIVVDAAGENTIIVSPGANGALTADSLDLGAIGETDVLCLGLEVPVPVVLAAAESAHGAGARVVLNLSPYAEVPGDLLALTDVLLVNRAEATQVLGWANGHDDPDWSKVLEGFVALGVRRAVVTLGSDGAVVLDANDSHRPVTRIEATPVEAVDTTGCGDAFAGATAHRLVGGASLVEAARFASGISALAATANGAQSSYSTFAR